MVFGLVFPVVLLVMFNSVFVRGNDTVMLDGVGVDAHAYFTGAMVAYAILLAAFSQLAISLVTQRESGQLEADAGTPVPAWTFIVATVLRSVTTIGSMAVVLVAIGRLAYEVPVSARRSAALRSTWSSERRPCAAWASQPQQPSTTSIAPARGCPWPR